MDIPHYLYTAFSSSTNGRMRASEIPNSFVVLIAKIDMAVSVECTGLRETVKRTVHPGTCLESAVGVYKFSSTLSLTSALDSFFGGGRVFNPPGKRPGALCTGGWVGPRDGLDLCEKSRPASPEVDLRTVQRVASPYI